MGWEQIPRADTFHGSNKPFISISSAHFSFNSMFVKTADLAAGMQVTMFADPEEMKLGFEFHSDERPNSFPLYQASAATKGEKRTALNCSGQQIVKKYPWVASVTKLSVKDRRFTPKKEGGLWAIQLCPAFEEKKARESADIPSEARGIYRYLRENGEIVYIGKGAIKQRLASPERREWDFDVVEYSIVNDPDQQVKWEDHWLTRYKEENKGKLPFYNKQSGISSKDKDES